MLRKLLDKVNSANLQKIKRDSQMQMKKVNYYLNQATNEIKTKAQQTKIQEKFPKILNYLKDQRKNFSLDKLDKLKNKKVDEWNYRFEKKIRESVSKMKNLFLKSKDAPEFVSKHTKSFAEEVKNYIRDSYVEGVAHMKKYFKDNQKFFEMKKKGYLEGFKKRKNNMLVIGGGAIFIYALGANIPAAIVKYKLAREARQETQVQDIKETQEIVLAVKPTSVLQDSNSVSQANKKDS